MASNENYYRNHPSGPGYRLVNSASISHFSMVHHLPTELFFSFSIYTKLFSF